MTRKRTKGKKTKGHRQRRTRRFWHYTVGCNLPAIIESGEIRVATAGVPVSERPAVWVSCNPIWDPTANKALSNSRTSSKKARRFTQRSHGGLARIGVKPEAAPIDWVSFKQNSNIDPKIARGLVRSSKAMGSHPKEWRASFEPIPASAWLSIETDTGNGWEPYDDDSWQVGTEAADHHATESNVATAAAMANDSPSGEFWAYSRPSESTEWSGVRIR